MRRGAIAVFSFVMQVAMATLAAAQEHPTLNLRFDAPAECRDARGFRDRVVSRLGYDPFVEGAEDVLELTIELDDDGYRATARLSGNARGARHLGPSATCSELLTAVATTVSILVDPLASPRPEPASTLENASPLDRARPVVTSEPVEPAVTSERAESELSTAPSSETSLTDVDTSPSPWMFGIGAHAGANLGFAPQPMSEFDLDLAFGNGTWSGEIGGRVRHSLTGISVADDSIVLGLYTGRIAGCYEAIAIGCIELELGAYVGDAAQRGATRAEFFAALGLRGGVRLHAAAGIAIDALVSLTLTPTPLRIWLDDVLASEMLPVAGSLVVGVHFFPSLG